MKSALFLGLIVAVLVGTVPTAFGVVKYVDVNQATGAHDGSEWTNAFENLTTALATVGANTDLWVAEGSYYPGPNQTDTFTMQIDVNLYGGFTNGMTSPGERDWQTHETILDGTNHNYHVVTSSKTMTFDGFIVQNGRADSGRSLGSPARRRMAAGRRWVADPKELYLQEQRRGWQQRQQRRRDFRAMGGEAVHIRLHIQQQRDPPSVPESRRRCYPY